MPNHVYNRVTFSGTRSDLYKVKKKLGMPHYMSQNIIPFNYFNLVAPTDEVAYRQGDAWYHWNIANWGTKWEAYELDCDFDQLDNDGDDDHRVDMLYAFCSAWSPPEKIMQAMCQYLEDAKLDVDMHWWYEEENGWGGIVGYEPGISGLSVFEQWDEPSSHAEYVERHGRECYCYDSGDKVWDDCPDPIKEEEEEQ